MNQVTKLKLIDGTFQIAEAKTLLLNLIGNKINFHSNEIFSHKIRFGNEHTTSKKRLTELLKEEKELRKFFNKISSENLDIEINCSVEIQLIQNKKS
jgi:hypothetical protein